jgi:hypothetical protein
VCLLWDSCVCKLNGCVLAVGQMCLQIELLCACCETDVFINWTVVCCCGTDVFINWTVVCCCGTDVFVNWTVVCLL